MLGVRLQKQLSRKLGDREYPKYVVVIPPEYVEKLQWKEGDELIPKRQGDRLVIEQAHAKKSAKAFRDKQA